MLERNLQSTIQGLMSVEAFRSKCQEYLVKESGERKGLLLLHNI